MDEPILEKIHYLQGHGVGILIKFLLKRGQAADKELMLLAMHVSVGVGHRRKTVLFLAKMILGI